MTLFILIALSMSGIGFVIGFLLFQLAKAKGEPDDFIKAPPSAPVSGGKVTYLRKELAK